MAFYGVGIDSEVARLIVDIKIKLAAKFGAYGLRQLDQGFRMNDQRGQGMVSSQDFIDILNQLGVFIRQIDQQALTKYFGRTYQGFIDYKSFVDRFRERLTPTQEEIVRTVFDNLDRNKNGSLDPNEISILLNQP